MRNLYQIMNNEREIESNRYSVQDMKNRETILNITGFHSCIICTSFTTIVKLAIYCNRTDDISFKFASIWRDEALAMMQAYYESGRYTAEEFANFFNQICHLMRVNYRTHGLKLKREGQ